MNETIIKTSSGGIGISGILTVIFVIAKLAGLITWSWWLVFAPLWLGFAIGLAIFIAVFLLALFAGILALWLE